MTTSAKTVLLNALAKRSDRALELQRGLTSFPALNPEIGGEGEWRKAQWLDERMRSYGLDNIEYMDAPDPRTASGKRPNRIVRVQGKGPRTLWVMGHLDVVPPGEESLWNTPPFELNVDPNDPDLIRGRGVEDNQQAIVSAVLLGAELVEQKIVPDLNLGILLVADEESGNAYGIDYVLANYPRFIQPDDMVVVPDFGTADGVMIEVAEKGTLWIKVTVNGVQCHGSTPQEGRNSLVAAAEMITRYQEVQALFPHCDPLFSPSHSTFTPTRHDANVPNVNTVPGKDVFYIDCRILPKYKAQDVLEAFAALGRDVGQKHGVEIVVESVNQEAQYPPTDPNSPVVQGMMKAIKAVYNIDCKPGGIGGSTVAGRCRGLGVAAAVWARVMPNYHMPNEASRLSHAMGDAQVFAHLLFD